MIESFEEYQKSLVDERTVYYRGKLVKNVNEHPILSLEVEPVQYLFQNKFRSFNKDFNTESSIFYKIPHNSDDLLERSNMTYEITKDLGMLWPHIGSDALLASRLITYDLETSDNFLKYHAKVVKENLFVCGAQIDVKGDRRLRPGDQEDKDLYVHVVEENDKGIIVKGAKFHTSMAAISNEIFVLPGRSLRKGEEDYAIAFAIPAGTKNVKLIARPAIATEGAINPMEGPRTRKRRMGETLTIFDNVFVPWERVFIYKDTKAASRLALMFALYHRLSAVSYRAALAEHLIGLGKLMAECNGISKASHIAKNITDLITFAEIQRCCAKMAALECHINKVPNIAIPNRIYTNVGKLFSNSNYMNVVQGLIDIAGGIAICAPSGDDYNNKELKPLIDKYMRGAYPGAERFKIMLLMREVIALMGGEESVIMIHAEGSMEASRIELYRSYDYTESEKIVKEILLEI
ncbi:4-hydroxybutyryl-CoA dehydratase [Desulfosarcina widdelii]|uniref:4-hydroxybutyryl-CoA dehydratase n=1 Tax=Desulfosarcina widdelii TaxID=947919 RepID=A0A5K7YUX1_9BACT|nr:4-hydroxyphenylacetate 3-hydroxylase N-terminal domain-containing protein [Desulfosarcina widdelii]BBO73096.1 4-hydroxybutyryl-CoA dehydratase [Desulfosarcina widdelii]